MTRNSNDNRQGTLFVRALFDGIGSYVYDGKEIKQERSFFGSLNGNAKCDKTMSYVTILYGL